MSNFTKGSWHYDGGRFIKNYADKIIADILPVLDYVDSLEEIAAIARLIAAAPDMCQHLRLILNGEFSSDDVEQLLARIDEKQA